MAISSVLGSSALLPAGLGFRNLFINGDFRINQRAFTSTTSDLVYTVDRWRHQASSGSTCSVLAFSTGNAIPNYEPTNYLRVVTTGQSGTGVYSLIGQPIEDVRTFAGQTVTISFWAKAASGTPKVAVEAYQGFGTGGSPSSAVTAYLGSATLSTSWQRYVITAVIPSISGKTIGTTANTSSLGFQFWVSAGTDFNARTNSLGIQSNTFDFWGMQVEANYQPTPFEQRPIETELGLCSRYFHLVPIGSMWVYNLYWNVGLSGGSQMVNYRWPVPMRIAPSITTSSGSSTALDFAYFQYAAGAGSGSKYLADTGGSTTVACNTLLYSSTNNSGNLLAANGYTAGNNQIVFWVSAEIF